MALHRWLGWVRIKVHLYCEYFILKLKIVGLKNFADSSHIGLAMIGAKSLLHATSIDPHFTYRLAMTPNRPFQP